MAPKTSAWSSWIISQQADVWHRFANTRQPRFRTLSFSASRTILPRPDDHSKYRKKWQTTCQENGCRQKMKNDVQCCKKKLLIRLKCMMKTDNFNMWKHVCFGKITNGFTFVSRHELPVQYKTMHYTFEQNTSNVYHCWQRKDVMFSHLTVWLSAWLLISNL